VAERVYICLFDLNAYDKRVAPALRKYQNQYDPSAAVAELRDIAGKPSTLAKDDSQHWIDALAPDAGYKPSPNTVHELADILIRNLCIPQMQEIDSLAPYLSEHSEWFSDLMDGGEELAGGRLEFTYGSGALIATRQQVRQFLDEVNRVPPPDGKLAVEYENLRKLLKTAATNPSYTLLKTGVAATNP